MKFANEIILPNGKIPICTISLLKVISRNSKKNILKSDQERFEIIYIAAST